MRSPEPSPSGEDSVVEIGEVPSWPLNQPTYVEIQPPNADNGYLTVLKTRFHDYINDFRVLNVTVGTRGAVVERRLSSTTDIDWILKSPRPDIRVFFFPKLDDTCWAVTTTDIKRIFTYYHVQPGIMVRLRAFKHSSGPESQRTYNLEPGKDGCDGSKAIRSYGMRIFRTYSTYSSFIALFLSPIYQTNLLTLSRLNVQHCHSTQRLHNFHTNLLHLRLHDLDASDHVLS